MSAPYDPRSFPGTPPWLQSLGIARLLAPAWRRLALELDRVHDESREGGDLVVECAGGRVVLVGMPVHAAAPPLGRPVAHRADQRAPDPVPARRGGGEQVFQVADVFPGGPHVAEEVHDP